MANPHFKSVDDYLESQPQPARAALERLRNIILQAIPTIEESIAYNMPTYKLHGQPVFNFAGWKKHYSLYAATDQVVAAFSKELAPFEIKRGTIQFPLSQPIPVDLIERIVHFRAAEVARR